MHSLPNASPFELFFFKLAQALIRRLTPVVACFCVFCFSTADAAVVNKKTAPVDPASCAVVSPAPPKKKTPGTKTAVKPATKSTPKKASASARRSRKAAVKPIVSTATREKAETIIATELPADLPQDLEREISKFFGLRYRLGGDGQSGIDCSALVKKVYADVFGVDLPRSSSEQSRFDTLDKVEEDELRTGDLLFFGPNRKRVNHVGMYLSGGYFLHAARSEGVTISKLDKSYWRSRFMFSKRARGLEIGEDADDAGMDLESELKRFSLSFAGPDDEPGMFSTLEAGIPLNDSLELILSGFFLNALAESEPAPNLPADELFSAPAPEPDAAESGFRLSALLTPLEWLKLIPSVTQLNEEERRREESGNTQQVGLETWMILPSSRVAVFMAAHADNSEDLIQQPLAFSPDWETMDVAIGLHYQLSNALRFSLWSTYSYSPDQKPDEESGRRSPTIEDVSFKLEMRF